MFRRIFNFIFDKLHNNYLVDTAEVGEKFMILVAGRGDCLDGKTIKLRGKEWYIVYTTFICLPVTAYTVRRVA